MTYSNHGPLGLLGPKTDHFRGGKKVATTFHYGRKSKTVGWGRSK